MDAGAGTWIDNVFMKSEGKVDADSKVSICNPPAVVPEEAIQVVKDARKQGELF